MNVKKTLLVGIIAGTMISCSNQPQEVKKLNNKLDSVSYAVGVSFGTNLKTNFDEVNRDALMQAIRDCLDSTDLIIKIGDVQTVIGPYFQAKQLEALKKKEKELEIEFAENKKAGEDFLAANKSKEGVITTKSGFQYKVLKEGKGATPKASDRIRIHYHGTTIDGKVFDSTVERNKPYEARANQFVTGFNEGLALMKVGSKYKFFIPQELAYKSRQRGELIQPFSALVFEVELLDIITKK